MTGAACDGCLRRSHLLGRLAGRIADALGSPRAPLRGLLRLDEEELIAAVGARDRQALRQFLAGFDPGDARARVAAAALHCVCRHCDTYPGSLLELDDPPVVLYATCPGERLRTMLEGPVVAIVGTRRPSPYGIEVAYELGGGLARAGVTVVSGLALGIDGHVHRGAVEAEPRDESGPIAVLACGADLAYPRRHRELYRRVRELGAVVSELPPGVAPFRWSFPARNRIMAGLARMTVVVEAGQPSGSLITTGFAADLGRDVGVVPGPVTTWRSDGTNKLLKDGASPICGPEDVLDALIGVGRAPPARAEPQLDEQLRAVLDRVDAGEAPEEMAARTGLGAAEVRAALARLELDGLIARDRFGAYRRSSRIQAGSLRSAT